jgi:hypothetical protein
MPLTTDFVGTAAPLTQTGFDAVVSGLTVDAPSLWSLVTVETRGFGFMADKRPKILFERHHFHRRTSGRFDTSDPDICCVDAGGYSPSGAGEYERLTRAIALDRKAALESASWGLGQIMGFNAAGLGYAGADDMVVTFMQGEDAQLDGSRRFIAHDVTLAAAFRRRDWTTVALIYNGKDFKRNNYDTKLQECFQKYSTQGTPSIELRAAQVRLTYLGFDPRGVDGVLGPGTRRALRAFQQAHTLPVSGEPDDATLEALKTTAGV